MPVRRTRQEEHDAIDKAIARAKRQFKLMQPQLYVDGADKDILAYDYAKEELVKCQQ